MVCFVKTNTYFNTILGILFTVGIIANAIIPSRALMRNGRGVSLVTNQVPPEWCRANFFFKVSSAPLFLLPTPMAKQTCPGSYDKAGWLVEIETKILLKMANARDIRFVWTFRKCQAVAHFHS